MSNLNPPFRVGDEVICVNDKPDPDWGKLLELGKVYQVLKISPFNTGCIMVSGSNYYWAPSRFRLLPPYYENISKELAKRAMEVGDGQDLKPVRKEVEV